MKKYYFAAFLILLTMLTGCDLFKQLEQLAKQEQEELEKNCTWVTYGNSVLPDNDDDSKTGWRIMWDPHPNGPRRGWCAVTGDVMVYSNGKGTESTFTINKAKGIFIRPDATIAHGAFTPEKADITVNGKTWEVIYGPKEVFTID